MTQQGLFTELPCNRWLGHVDVSLTSKLVDILETSRVLAYRLRKDTRDREVTEIVGPLFPCSSCYLFFADLPLYDVSPPTALPKTDEQLSQWSPDSVRGQETPTQIPHISAEVKQGFELFCAS